MQRYLQSILQKEPKQLDLPAPKLLWPHMEKYYIIMEKN